MAQPQSCTGTGSYPLTGIADRDLLGVGIRRSNGIAIRRSLDPLAKEVRVTEDTCQAYDDHRSQEIWIKTVFHERIPLALLTLVLLHGHTLVPVKNITIVKLPGYAHAHWRAAVWCPFLY
jgi:hypothetical protein